MNLDYWKRVHSDAKKRAVNNFQSPNRKDRVKWVCDFIIGQGLIIGAALLVLWGIKSLLGALGAL